eukprot:210575-Alexandrium_andersonii.AAC.1
MADACDEGLLLVRYHDNEQYETAGSPEYVAHTIHHLVFLFVQRGCLRVPGCTKFALDLLATIHTYTVDQETYALGYEGP